MKKYTQKKIYVSLVAGLSVLSSVPAFSAINTFDDDADGTDDAIRYDSDTGTGFVFVSPFLGGTGDGGRVAVGNNLGTPNSNWTDISGTAIRGDYIGATNQNHWTFGENGFSDNIDDAPGGGTDVNTTTRSATLTTNLITDGSDISTRSQAAGAQIDVATETAAINGASRVQTKFGQTDTAAIAGGSTATRAQTATTQNDGIVNGANSNRLASTVGRTTRTVVGTGGTTVVDQDDRDFIASTGAGAGSAEMSIKRSSGSPIAKMVVTTSTGHEKGLVVEDGKTTLSGGTNSTTFVLDDSGAKFAGAGGAPARVTGIADGIADFDAVNFRQLNNLDKKLSGKINETGAVAAAFAQLGQAQTPGKSTFGIAAGGQGSKAGVALGFSHRPVTMKPVVIKASLGASGKTVAGGIGATWEF